MLRTITLLALLATPLAAQARPESSVARPRRTVCVPVQLVRDTAVAVAARTYLKADPRTIVHPISTRGPGERPPVRRRLDDGDAGGAVRRPAR